MSKKKVDIYTWHPTKYKGSGDRDDGSLKLDWYIENQYKKFYGYSASPGCIRTVAEMKKRLQELEFLLIKIIGASALIILFIITLAVCL